VNQATVTDVHNTTANVNVQPDVSDANRITSVISSNSDDDKNEKNRLYRCIEPSTYRD
jgi:hypothetical protein